MADKGRLTVAQKTKIVLLFTATKSVTLTQRRFRAHFGTRWAPSPQTIRRLHQKFAGTGCVFECKRPHARTVRSPQNIEAVRVALTRSPSKSTRRTSAALGISRRSVQRILQSDLILYPYKMTVAHKLTARDKERRLQFARWAIEQDQEAVLHNTWFSDEAYFYVNGVVNRQNVRFWAREPPRVIHMKDTYGEKVCVWVAMSSHGIIGPFFFDATVTGERYLDMLRNQFFPQLMSSGLPLQTQWFMQDGARPHTANVVLDFLHERLGLRVLSNRFPERYGGGMWPPHSPDINPCDFFLWGFLKEKVYLRKPENAVQLRAIIVELCRAISEDLCRRVITNARVRLEEVVRQNGGHIEHVIH